jgi:hypothetical protein
MSNIEFRTGVIRPLDCFREGWALLHPHFWLMFAITTAGMLLAGFAPFGLLIGPMYCGIYLCFFLLVQGRRPEFGDLFNGFSFFVPSLVATLILIVPMVIFAAVSTASVFGLLAALTDSRGNLDPSAIFALYGVVIAEGIVFALVIGCIHAFVMFAYPLIIEYNLSGLEAFKLSSRASWANLSGVIGLIIWEFVIGLIGSLACGVGLYFTFPIMFAAVLIAYRKVFPGGPGVDKQWQ